MLPAILIAWQGAEHPVYLWGGEWVPGCSSLWTFTCISITRQMGLLPPVCYERQPTPTISWLPITPSPLTEDSRDLFLTLQILDSLIYRCPQTAWVWEDWLCTAHELIPSAPYSTPSGIPPPVSRQHWPPAGVESIGYFMWGCLRIDSDASPTVGLLPTIPYHQPVPLKGIGSVYKRHQVTKFEHGNHGASKQKFNHMTVY